METTLIQLLANNKFQTFCLRIAVMLSSLVVHNAFSAPPPANMEVPGNSKFEWVTAQTRTFTDLELRKLAKSGHVVIGKSHANYSEYLQAIDAMKIRYFNPNVKIYFYLPARYLYPQQLTDVGVNSTISGKELTTFYKPKIGSDGKVIIDSNGNAIRIAKKEIPTDWYKDEISCANLDPWFKSQTTSVTSLDCQNKTFYLLQEYVRIEKDKESNEVITYPKYVKISPPTTEWTGYGEENSYYLDLSKLELIDWLINYTARKIKYGTGHRAQPNSDNLTISSDPLLGRRLNAFGAVYDGVFVDNARLIGLNQVGGAESFISWRQRINPNKINAWNGSNNLEKIQIHTSNPKLNTAITNYTENGAGSNGQTGLRNLLRRLHHQLNQTSLNGGEYLNFNPKILYNGYALRANADIYPERYLHDAGVDNGLSKQHLVDGGLTEEFCMDYKGIPYPFIINGIVIANPRLKRLKHYQEQKEELQLMMKAANLNRFTFSKLKYNAKYDDPSYPESQVPKQGDQYRDKNGNLQYYYLPEDRPLQNAADYCESLHWLVWKSTGVTDNYALFNENDGYNVTSVDYHGPHKTYLSPLGEPVKFSSFNDNNLNNPSFSTLTEKDKVSLPPLYPSILTSAGYTADPLEIWYRQFTNGYIYVNATMNTLRFYPIADGCFLNKKNVIINGSSRSVATSYTYISKAKRTPIVNKFRKIVYNVGQPLPIWVVNAAGVGGYAHTECSPAVTSTLRR